jgi:hypothetical protein
MQHPWHASAASRERNIVMPSADDEVARVLGRRLTELVEKGDIEPAAALAIRLAAVTGARRSGARRSSLGRF